MSPLQLSLPDGTPVTARALTPDDREGLAQAYRLLSPESRRNRFWTYSGELGDAMMNRILDQDPRRHISWAVLDPSRDFQGLGAASWWRDPANPEEAEFSVIVLDEDQGRGVGTLLLRIMSLTARHAGIRELVAYVDPENQRAVRWLNQAGASGGWDGHYIALRWRLDEPPRAPEDGKETPLMDLASLLIPEDSGLDHPADVETGPGVTLT